MARTKQSGYIVGGRTTLGPRGTNIGHGFDLLGAEDLTLHDRRLSKWNRWMAQHRRFGTAGVRLGGEVTIPTAGANYTDAKTVAAVQKALVDKGYNVGASGPNGDGVDGIYGSKTKAAIKKLQAAIGAEQNGRIDEGVIAALKVTPGVLPPGVTMQGRAAVQAQAALDAATAAEHAVTPSDAQNAAQQLVTISDSAAPPPPPEVRQKVATAVAAVQAAKTPEAVRAAVASVVSAAQDVHTAVAPPWYELPAWDGGPPRWQVGAVGGAGLTGVGLLLYGLLS